MLPSPHSEQKDAPSPTVEGKFPSFPHEPISLVTALLLFVISMAAAVWVLAAFSLLPNHNGPDWEGMKNSPAVLFSFQSLIARPLFWIVEEALFRGFLLQVLRRRFSLPTAAFVTAVLFGAEHFAKGLPTMVLAFGASYYFAWLMIRTDSLFAPIVAHCSFDFAALYVIFPIAAATGRITEAKYAFPYWWLAAAALVLGVGVFLLRGELRRSPTNTSEPTAPSGRGSP